MHFAMRRRVVDEVQPGSLVTHRGSLRCSQTLFGPDGFLGLKRDAVRSEIIASREVCLLGGVMSGQNVRVSTYYACAYCGEPLSFTSNGVNAWRVGDRFVCNEFCADGISADDRPASAFGQPQTGYNAPR